MDGSDRDSILGPDCAMSFNLSWSGRWFSPLSSAYWQSSLTVHNDGGSRLVLRDDRGLARVGDRGDH